MLSAVYRVVFCLSVWLFKIIFASVYTILFKQQHLTYLFVKLQTKAQGT